MKKAVFGGLVVALAIGLGGFALASGAGHAATQITPRQKVIDELRKETLMQSEGLQGVYAQTISADKKTIDQLHEELLQVVDLRGLYDHS